MVEQFVEQQLVVERRLVVSRAAGSASGAATVRTSMRRAARALGAHHVPSWALNAFTAAIGLLLLWRLDQAPASTGFALQWWALAPMFAVAEVCVVHLHFRRDAHTIALAEVPLALGLFFASPAALVAGRIAGSAVALVLHRRQRPLKLAFNLAMFLTETATAVTVFAAIRGDADLLSSRTVIAALVACVVACPLGTLWVAVAATVAGLPHQLRGVPRVLLVAVPVTLLNALLAVAGARLVDRDPVAALLTLVPLVALAVAYHRYTGERRKHERLELLYNSSQALHRAHGIDGTISTLLRTAREMFCAELAEVVLLPADEHGNALHLSLAAGDAEVRQQVRPARPVAVDAALRGCAVLLPRATGSRAHTPLDGVRDGMLVPLSGENGVFSTLLVANRSSDVASFDRADLTLMETFAAQASISMEKGRLAAEMERMAYCDSLTQLANRALLTARLGGALARRDRGRPAVLFVDLDDFKAVNDTMGHTAGDRLLVVAAQRLRNCLRAQDVAARIGGDEFAVLLENVDAGTAAEVAERVVASMRLPYSIDMEDVSLHASVGVVVAAEADDNADELLARADIAMYRAKEQGKGRWEMFAAPLQQAVVERHRLKNELRQALVEQNLFVAYQPIVALRGEGIVGAEALVRWRHERLGMVPPDEFIPLAEESGMIVALGQLVLDDACAQAAAWGGDEAPFVTVNISARQLQHATFAADVAETLRRTGVAPHRLVLEITERVMVEDDPRVRDCLDELRALGLRLAIDDFGTGYSSLSCLRELPVDIIKIAKSFVDDVAGDRHAAAFAAAIVRLGETLGVELIAEGIENAEQAQFLRRLHCGMGQGWLFGRPMRDEALAAALGLREPAVAGGVPAA